LTGCDRRRRVGPGLNPTRDAILPTTITGSYPRPHWFTEELRGRGFKDALGDSRFREQYLDAVACRVREQEMAGLDIVTDGDSRFDLTVGGKSWFFYAIERLRGITATWIAPRAAAGVRSGPATSSPR
jgi:5-methyltetrahydropteroyltriglutamate--homocysteine methyltransferase